MTAVNIFMDSYQGVYSQGMAAELRRRYPKISKQLDFLWKRKDITTTDPAKLTPEDIREYVKYQRMRGLKPASISHDVSAISMLCKVTAGNRCVEIARIKYPLLFPKRDSKRLPVTERPEYERILRFAGKLTADSDPMRIRAYAEVLFAYGTGARTIELQHAKNKFLEQDLTCIFVDHVKGMETYGQARTVPIRPEVRPTLRLWLTVRSDTSDYLFHNQVGQPLSTNSLTKDRTRVCKEVGIDFDYRKCRRTYALYLIDEGLPVDKLAVILGHSSSKTTEKSYARPRDDRVVAEIIRSWQHDTEVI